MTLFLLFTDEITKRTWLSILFVLIPYILTAGLTCIGKLDSQENIMQNNTLLLLTGAYLGIAFLVTVVLNVMRIPLDFFLAGEIIVMVAGFVAVLIGFLGKSHIES